MDVKARKVRQADLLKGLEEENDRYAVLRSEITALRKKNFVLQGDVEEAKKAKEEMLTVQKLKAEVLPLQGRPIESETALKALTTDQLTYHDLIRKNNDLIAELEKNENEHKENLKKALEFSLTVRMFLNEAVKESVEATTIELLKKLSAVLPGSPTSFKGMTLTADLQDYFPPVVLVQPTKGNEELQRRGKEWRNERNVK